MLGASRGPPRSMDTLLLVIKGCRIDGGADSFADLVNVGYSIEVVSGR
jgi:hypothetical protein